MVIESFEQGFRIRLHLKLKRNAFPKATVSPRRRPCPMYFDATKRSGASFITKNGNGIVFSRNVFLDKRKREVLMYPLISRDEFHRRIYAARAVGKSSVILPYHCPEWFDYSRVL
jgi:hypothetical protein